MYVEARVTHHIGQVMKNHTSIKNAEYKYYQVRECLMDPQPWILAIHAFLQCLQGGGLTSVSGPQTLERQHSDKISVLQNRFNRDSQLLQSPGYFDEHAVQHYPLRVSDLCVSPEIPASLLSHLAHIFQWLVL